MNKATEALNAGLVEYELQTDVEIVNVKHGHVLVLGFDQDPAKPNVAYHMIKLERFMKAVMKVDELELQCESIDDRNKRDVKHGRKLEKMVNARNVESLEV